jgi:hypothetical protein
MEEISRTEGRTERGCVPFGAGDPFGEADRVGGHNPGMTLVDMGTWRHWQFRFIFASIIYPVNADVKRI